MGSSSSKVAGRAAGAARRQFPSTSSITNNGSSSSASSNVHAQAPLEATASTSHPAPVQVRPSPAASPAAGEESEQIQIDLDGRDPQFDSVLRSLGPAKPPSASVSASGGHGRPVEDVFPTSSQPMQQGHNIFPSAAQNQNPAIMLVQARERIAKRWEKELDDQGRPSFAGRTVVTAKDVKEALAMRDEAGRSVGQIEKQLGLKPGILDQLVPKRVVANA